MPMGQCVRDGEVACSAREPGFDPSNIQMGFLLSGKRRQKEKMAQDVKNGTFQHFSVLYIKSLAMTSMGKHSRSARLRTKIIGTLDVVL